MVMFLTLMMMSLLALAVCVAAFGLATAGVDAQRKLEAGQRAHAPEPRFFARAERPPASVEQVPIEVLLAEIERHVRLEQAAAEAFLEQPTRDGLRAPTASSLLN